jgi:toxin YoeB
MSRRLAWTDEVWADYLYRQGQDRKTLRRIDGLIEAVMREPFAGVGKPEPLRESLAGLWSRRIDATNRLVYAVDDDLATIVSCRYHD